jgi:hypothetical protein
LRPFLLLLSCGLLPGVVHAETGGIRLSSWLVNQGIAVDDYPSGLMWMVPEEKVAQSKLKDDIRRSVLELDEKEGRNAKFLSMLEAMPVTGRVPVSIVDVDWLQANPHHDPVIRASHVVYMPKRPTTVTVLTSAGERCDLPHTQGIKAVRYVDACIKESSVDWVWVVQPDGKRHRYGIAIWNGQIQDEPAPGAWIWAPYRRDDWSDALSEKLASFLATQGVQLVLQNEKKSSRSAEAGSDFDEPRDLALTASDWGSVGLLQTPTARVRPEGYSSMVWSNSYPYTRLNVFLQPYEWMEFGFRYTSVSNRLYGKKIAGNQAFKDKSIDVKLRLIDESVFIPQIAIGFFDVSGTGKFSGEYLVANKRTGDFDWSLGLGWGYTGGRRDIPNPLSSFSKRFDVRPGDAGVSDSIAFGDFFRGRTALFGGLQYQTRWDSLILKLEYEGNDYQHQPQNNNFPQASPWNVGAVYRIDRGIEMALGYERGNTVVMGITLQTNLKNMATPKIFDPAPIPVSEYAPSDTALSLSTVRDFENQTGWAVRSVEQHGNKLQVRLDDARAVYWREKLERANSVLHRDAPPEIDLFSYVHRQRGIDIVEHQVDRVGWMEEKAQPVPPSLQKDPVAMVSVGKKSAADSVVFKREASRFRFDPGLAMRYNLGGPDGFLLYQIYAEGNVQFRLREDTWLQGSVHAGLIDNYDNFKYTAPSRMPRVRTYLREYLTSSNVTMPNLQLTHVGKLSENQYYSVYGGYLESMFAGAGAEWMYRSLGSPFALGIDVNRVQQRGFKQDTELRKYKIDTGHATLYWDTGWNEVQANLSAGRYLAGDSGVTVELSRLFQNGVRIGGHFTKTNVSAKQFGEGSFDKALFVSIPFDAMLGKTVSRIANFAWRPLIRDGGAKLGRAVQLYDVNYLLDPRVLKYHSADLDGQIQVPTRRKIEWGESAE